MKTLKSNQTVSEIMNSLEGDTWPIVVGLAEKLLKVTKMSHRTNCHKAKRNDIYYQFQGKDSAALAVYMQESPLN